MKELPDKEKRPLASKTLNATESAGLPQKGDAASSKPLVSWTKARPAPKRKMPMPKASSNRFARIRGAGCARPSKHSAGVSRYVEENRRPEGSEKSGRRSEKKLPGALFSGQFSRRASDALLRHAGLLFAPTSTELGERLEEVWAKLLRKSAFVGTVSFSYWRRPKGHLPRTCRRGRSSYASYFAVRAHVEELTQVQIDESGKDVARLCFLSYIPTPTQILTQLNWRQ